MPRFRRCSTHRPQKEALAGFSLVELVIVIVIIGIVAAIAVPRIGRASQSAQANAILATLNNVRQAIDHFYAEHGRYPGFDPSTLNASDAKFAEQLTLYSNAKGEVSSTKTNEFTYGPYLRKPFPTNPVNGLQTVRVKASASALVSLGSTGWIANLQTGDFTINASANQLRSLKATEATITAIERVTDLPGG